jgi:hypothetical protein
MFSGGRDSTLAALRMATDGAPMALVTVTSGHLVGIERVKTRLRELAPLLPPETSWLQVRQPTELRTDTSFYETTCLPCHHAYVVVSGAVARLFGATRLAFGYVTYQQGWPEQTPLAINRLRNVLAYHEITLELPVYDVPAKEHIIAELAAYGLSTFALEQKCLQQIKNVELSEERLEQQVKLWEQAIDQSMCKLDEISIDVMEERRMSEFR